jgi:hypothetical protein
MDVQEMLQGEGRPNHANVALPTQQSRVLVIYALPPEFIRWKPSHLRRIAVYETTS